MEILIVKFIITYMAIATFVLLNFLYNPNIEFYFENKETKEIKHPSSFILCIFSLYWIIIFPFLLIISKRSKDDE